MFGRLKARKPADTPFSHAYDCKTPDAQPEWWEDTGQGRWVRVCSCDTQYARMGLSEIDPGSALAEPSWQAHKHHVSCEAPSLESIVIVERAEDAGGWRSRCVVCTSSSYYRWDPNRRDRDGNPVTGEYGGFIRYQYPLKHQVEPVAG